MDAWFRVETIHNPDETLHPWVARLMIHRLATQNPPIGQSVRARLRTPAIVAKLLPNRDYKDCPVAVLQADALLQNLTFLEVAELKIRNVVALLHECVGM